MFDFSNADSPKPRRSLFGSLITKFRDASSFDSIDLIKLIFKIKSNFIII